MPASWEIQDSRDKRILLSIILPPDLAVSIYFAKNLRVLQLPPGSDFLEVTGFPFGPARNKAARHALDNGYNLAFLDADTRVPPDAYIKLLETGLDLVCGLYYQRQYPYAPVPANEGRDEKGNVIRVPIIGWKPGDMVPATFIPSGLTIYRRRLLEKIFEVHPTPFQWGVDLVKVPDYGGGEVPPFSEDYVMSYRSKLLGFQGYCDTRVVGLHELRAVVGPRYIIPLPYPDPAYGVIGVV